MTDMGRLATGPPFSSEGGYAPLALPAQTLGDAPA